MRTAFDPQVAIVLRSLRSGSTHRVATRLFSSEGLQHIYSQTELRDELLDAVAQDVNGTPSVQTLAVPG